MIPIITGHDVLDLHPVQMATFAAFANNLAQLGLGIHCSKCGKDLQGKNADIDQIFTVSCGCRDFKCDNPRPRVLD